MSQQVAQYPHKMTDSEIVGAIERIATTATKHKILAQKQDCCNEEAAIHRNYFTSSQKYSFYNLSAGVCEMRAHRVARPLKKNKRTVTLVYFA
jgi:hypothetical protein